MKEFKFCGEMTEYVEIPVYVCETQKEMVKEISEIREVSFNDYVYEKVESIEFNRQCAIKERKEHGYSAWFYDEQIRSVIGTSDETSIYIIYKDGSKYFETFGERQGKFKRYGIKAAVIETAYEYTVFGDFAITDNGDISIEESDIEEYGVYAGQYDVKEQEAQEVQEAEQETAETVEGISKMETTTEADDSGFEYTTSQAQEIIMTGTSIAREKYREKHNIHNPMDLKKFSKKQLDDYLSKELDYINKFLNDTIPKEVFNTMKGETMYA